MRRALAWLAVAVASAALAQPSPDPPAVEGGRPSAAASVPSPSAAAGSFAAGVKAFDQGRPQEAFALWLPLAEQGMAAAQFNLAVLYEQGLGVAKNDVEAARWYRAAAERGDVAAQLKTGSLYEQGVGVARDVDRAGFWYGEAAKGGAKDADAARQARSRLAALRREVQVGPEDVTAFEGGRFVLRQAADKECVVALQGMVTQSASFKFDDVVKKAKAQGCARPLTLLLESPGGQLDAGFALGRSVREEGMRTVARYECASSCASIFLGGTERIIWGARAAIGLHQPAVVREGEDFKDRRCITRTDDPGVIAFRRYIHFVTPETADEILRVVLQTPCQSITWVRGNRALELHVATRIEAEGRDAFGPRERHVDASASAPP
jgi:hypothetical protein